MKNYNDAVSKLFDEKEKLIILGLTGRTGAGCSTAASILKRDFDQLDLEYIKQDNDTIDDDYKFNVIKEYIGANQRWTPFTVIEGSCVILSYIFEYTDKYADTPSGALINYLQSLKTENDIQFRIDNFEALEKELRGLDYIFKAVQEKPLNEITGSWSELHDTIDEYYELYINKMPQYREIIRKILLKYTCYEEKKKKLQDEPKIRYHLYTYLFQKIGNNIRSSGNPYDNQFSQDKIFSFAQRLEKLIELIIKYDSLHNKRQTRICIDAIRNANESNYLKDKYRPYFLLSVSVDENTRRKRLGKMNSEEQNSLDNVEYNSKLEAEEFFYHQNIANCFEMADIHLVNNNEKNGKYFLLTWQLIKYITLMIHPGLITPNAIERCMQLAYNAKYSSGCLSRQVGAVVTDSDYSVKSVGWNDVPEGQMSCSLRNIHDYCKGNKAECFSQFEYEDENFRKVLNGINKTVKELDLYGRKFPYCFKDIYNGYKKERNQVYTRSLHAEENAFLQISKYGGQGIKGGYLFCTASPCELCAKKSYQLGIDNIYYIDPYPGISKTHILTFGKDANAPKMHLFYGSIGEAYIRLYKPLLPYKDELELVSGIDCKAQAQKVTDNAPKYPNTEDLSYDNIEWTLEFIDRDNIEAIKSVDIEIKKGEHSELNRYLTWTGSSYDRAELIENTENYSLVDSKDTISPYEYKIKLNKIAKPTEHIKYKIKHYLKDEGELMHEYLSQTIQHPTKHIKLSIITSKNSPVVENIKYVRYADSKMEIEYLDNMYDVQVKEENDKIISFIDIDNPNLFYTYSLEWDFIKIKSKNS